MAGGGTPGAGPTAGGSSLTRSRAGAVDAGVPPPVPDSGPAAARVLDHAAELLALCDRDGDGRLRWANRAWQALAEQLWPAGHGSALERAAVTRDRPVLGRLLHQARSQPGTAAGPVTLRLRRRDGTAVVAELRATDLGHDPAIGGVLLAGRDVTAEALSFRLLSGEAEVVTAAAAGASAAEVAEAVAALAADLCGPGARAALLLAAGPGNRLEAHTPHAGELRLPVGGDEAAEPLGWLTVDLAAAEAPPPDVHTVLHRCAALASRALAHVWAAAALDRRARVDHLTGLPNRLTFTDALEAAVARLARGGRGHAVAVLFADLDGFKALNDTFGHDAGDEVLRKLSARMAAAAGVHVIARFGGDEFLVLVEGEDDPDRLAALARRVADACVHRVEMGGRSVDLSASVGVAVAATAPMEAAELVRRADIALNRAKQAGRSRVEFFRPVPPAGRSPRLRDALRQAVRNGDLELVFQPEVSLSSGSVVGFEVLTRWDHPHFGRVDPTEFIAVAEEGDVICELGRWVVASVARVAALHAVTRPRRRPGLPTLWVNLSARQVASPGEVDALVGMLSAFDLPPGAVAFELTETAVVDLDEASRARLAGLRRRGHKLAIDDFGTGHSSLSRLRELPADLVKVDRRLVAGAAPANEAGQFLRAIVALCRVASVEVLAEGVESDDEVAAVRAAGCDTAQGWRFGRAVPAADLARAARRRAQP